MLLYSGIIKASFKTKKEGIIMNVIQCYAPTNDSNDDDKGQFYGRPVPLNPLAIEAAPTDLPTAITPSTIEEIRMDIRQIRSGKAARLDNIPAEAMKSNIQNVTEPDERFSRHPAPSSIGWIPYGSVAHRPNCDDADHR
ncbi:unnamed protein product [Schistosoma curassoni]|uniref:Reverse transcriptase domain-containing protein n=1 Tax=Schistosoma curassoni TaxID=6186 RepID=A0A183K4C2_9TREM|nr:unnamed protein product [Schistosoma curassoni]